MAYKAIVTSVSDIDSSGHMEVTFELRKGSNVLYPNLVVSGQADTIAGQITEKATELSAQIREGKKIKVGDEFTVEE